MYGQISRLVGLDGFSVGRDDEGTSRVLRTGLAPSDRADIGWPVATAAASQPRSGSRRPFLARNRTRSLA